MTDVANGAGERREPMRSEECVGRRVRQRRMELELTQEELGRRLEPLLGIAWSRQAVSAAESGNRAFNVTDLFALATVLDCKPARLLTPPLRLDEIEMPTGAKVQVRHLVDFGVADHDLGEVYYELVGLLSNLADAASATQRARERAKRFGDRLTAPAGDSTAQPMSFTVPVEPEPVWQAVDWLGDGPAPEAPK